MSHKSGEDQELEMGHVSEGTRTELCRTASSLDVNKSSAPSFVARLYYRVSASKNENVESMSSKADDCKIEVGTGEGDLEDASSGAAHEGETEYDFSRSLNLPEEAGKNTILLKCDSSAPGGVCFINVVGTAHVSKASCEEVKAVVRHVKPQVVFLELCESREAVLQPPEKRELLTASQMLETWKKKEMNLFGLILTWFLAKVGEKLEVFPGSEFRVAYEESAKCDSKISLGDRPIQITLKRTWAKMSAWTKAKLLVSMFFSCFILPSADDLTKMLEQIQDEDEMTYLIQEFSKTFPTLEETLIHERDLYMVASLRSIARDHGISSIVAVVGKGHLKGIAKNWNEDISVEELLKVPRKRSSSRLRMWTAVALIVAGVATVAGVHKMHSQ